MRQSSHRISSHLIPSHLYFTVHGRHWQRNQRDEDRHQLERPHCGIGVHEAVRLVMWWYCAVLFHTPLVSLFHAFVWALFVKGWEAFHVCVIYPILSIVISDWFTLHHISLLSILFLTTVYPYDLPISPSLPLLHWFWSIDLAASYLTVWWSGALIFKWFPSKTPCSSFRLKTVTYHVVK